MDQNSIEASKFMDPQRSPAIFTDSGGTAAMVELSTVEIQLKTDKFVGIRGPPDLLELKL